MKTLVIKPKPIIKNDDYQKRYCIIERFESETLQSSDELFYQVPNNMELAEFDDCDNYLIATVFDAMSEKRNVIIDGTISKQLLINLREFMECWAKWLPNDLYAVKIKPKEVVTRLQLNENCISAYSGGVDASFSVWKSHKKRDQIDSYTINSCAFIHGMDIFLDDNKSYDKAFLNGKKTLAELNINLIPIKTNFRQIIRFNWEFTHACGLISSLSVLKKQARTCLLGSSEPYEHLVIPWGSNPITDHLLSSDDFTIVHDGAAYNRIEKSKYLLDWEDGVRNLRVCWEKNHNGTNCGTCEKCVRTKLIFHILNSDLFGSFSEKALLESLKSIKIYSAAQKNEWNYITNYVEVNKILSRKTISQIKRKMRKPLDQIIIPVNSKARLLLRKIFKR